MANDSRRVLLISLACVLPFAIVNFVAAPLGSRVGGPHAPGAVLVFLCAGTIGAEAALHAIWCVLAPVRFAKRLVIGVGVGVALYGVWVLGYAASLAEYFHLHSYYYWGEVSATLLCLPLLAIAIQSPLWLARIWLGWRVEHRVNAPRGSDVEPFRIRHLLGATAAVALALSAARLGVPDDGESFLGLAIAALVVAGISLFATLPAVVATLRARRLWLVLPAILLVDIAALLAVFVILCAVFQEWPRAEEFVGIVVVGLGFFAGLTGVMLLVRALGYRLAWGRRKTTSIDGDSVTSG